MEFYEPIRAYEPLTAISYPCESRAFSFLRCYALERDGAVVGRAASIWALVDIESRALVPVTGIDMDLELLPHNDMSIDRIVMPKSITEVGTYTVNYADTDQNRHMNNTHYPDMLCDFVPEMRTNRATGMVISYRHEAAFGHTLRVFCTKTEGGYLICTIDEDGTVCTEALLRLAPVNNA